MRTDGKISAAFCLLNVSIGLLLLGTVFVQFAGSAGRYADISEMLRKEKKELAQALLSSGNSSARLLRSSRQRNSTQGRFLSSRSGSDGIAAQSENNSSLIFFAVPESDLFSAADKVHSFWTDFIISALPVRAGPLNA